MWPLHVGPWNWPIYVNPAVLWGWSACEMDSRRHLFATQERSLDISSQAPDTKNNYHWDIVKYLLEFKLINISILLRCLIFTTSVHMDKRLELVLLWRYKIKAWPRSGGVHRHPAEALCALTPTAPQLQQDTWAGGQRSRSEVIRHKNQLPW